MLRNLGLDGRALKPLVFEGLEKSIMFLIQPEADFFEDRLGVSRIDDVGAALGERVIEIGRVCKVEIAGDQQVAGRPNRFSGVRVARDRIKSPRGSVTKVAQQEFAAEIEVTLNGFWKLRYDGRLADLIRVGLNLAGKDLRQSLGPDFPVTEEEGFTIFCPNLNTTDTCAILAAVVLFLHQEK